MYTVSLSTDMGATGHIDMYTTENPHFLELE